MKYITLRNGVKLPKLGPTLYENESAIEDTMKRLGVDYLDILLLHSPLARTEGICICTGKQNAFSYP